MSGGSYDYIYSRLEEECDGRMYDAEIIITRMNMLRDGINLILKHDLGYMGLRQKNIRISTYGSSQDVQKAIHRKGAVRNEYRLR